MPGPLDAFDNTRPIPSDTSSQLTETIRNIKTVLIDHESRVDTLDAGAPYAPAAGNASQTFLVATATAPGHAINKGQFDAVVQARAAWSASGGTKTSDVKGNVTIDSFTHDTGANTVTYVLSFSGLPALTESAGVRNHTIIATNFVGAGYYETTLNDSNTVTLVCNYETNAPDAQGQTISGVLLM